MVTQITLNTEGPHGVALPGPGGTHWQWHYPNSERLLFAPVEQGLQALAAALVIIGRFVAPGPGPPKLVSPMWRQKPEVAHPMGRWPDHRYTGRR
jgi:hypothetical protein